MSRGDDRDARRRTHARSPVAASGGRSVASRYDVFETVDGLSHVVMLRHVRCAGRLLTHQRSDQRLAERVDVVFGAQVHARAFRHDVRNVGVPRRDNRRPDGLRFEQDGRRAAFRIAVRAR